MKPNTIKEYNPLISKSGNDQTIAYSVLLHKDEQGIYIEAMLGSDDIGGAHLLKYKLPKEQWLQWHDILFRFNGKISELYIDGILRDNEVTEGETRVLTSCFMPDDAITYGLHSDGDINVTAVIHTLKSAWENKKPQ